MKQNRFYLKFIHTIIWAFYTLIIFYILFAGIFDQFTIYLWISIGLVNLEVFILIFFKGKCPITILGYNYIKDPEIGYDIFLPKWLAKNNQRIFGTLLIVGGILIILRLLF